MAVTFKGKFKLTKNIETAERVIGSIDDEELKERLQEILKEGKTAWNVDYKSPGLPIQKRIDLAFMANRNIKAVAYGDRITINKDYWNKQDEIFADIRRYNEDQSVKMAMNTLVNRARRAAFELSQSLGIADDVRVIEIEKVRAGEVRAGEVRVGDVGLSPTSPPPSPPSHPPPPPSPPSPPSQKGLEEARRRIQRQIPNLLGKIGTVEPIYPVKSIGEIIDAFKSEPDPLYGLDNIVRQGVGILRFNDWALIGKAGTGKSTVAIRICEEAFNVDYIMASVDPSWFPTDLTASISPSAFVAPWEGIVTGYLMKCLEAHEAGKPTWLILDEATRAEMGIYYSPMMLARTLRFITIPLIAEAQKIAIPNNFRIIITANIGDEGTYRRPDAIKDRFASSWVPYPDQEWELKAMMEKGGLKKLREAEGMPLDPENLGNALITIAKRTRREDQGFRKGISTRTLLNISRYIVYGLGAPTHPLYDYKDGDSLAYCLADGFYTYVVDNTCSEGKVDDLEQIQNILEGVDGQPLRFISEKAIDLIVDYINTQLGK